MSIMKWKFLLFILILQGLLTACTQNPSPNYSPSEMIRLSLQQVGVSFGETIPVPTFLPEGYSIGDVQINQQEYQNQEVVLTITKLNAPDILLFESWMTGGPFRVLPTSDQSVSVDISGGSGTYSKWAILNYLSDRNTLWWDWIPGSIASGPFPYYELELSAAKTVPVNDLIAIAKFVH